MKECNVLMTTALSCQARASGVQHPISGKLSQVLGELCSRLLLQFLIVLLRTRSSLEHVQIQLLWLLCCSFDTGCCITAAAHSTSHTAVLGVLLCCTHDICCSYTQGAPCKKAYGT